MTLEDFFTLTEMRDGLSCLTRVGELLLVIQNLKDPDTSDVVDALRQWSTVASTLTATKNDECLNQFLSLNGHSFLNKWLQKALHFSEDTGGNVVEELITSLLASFERLPIDIDTANSSGIAITIKHLLNHKCLEIKDKARNLFDKWDLKTDDTSGDNDLVKDSACQKEELRTVEDTQINISECNKETCEREHASQHSDDTKFSDSSHPGCAKTERVPTSNQFLPSISSNCINTTTVLGEVDSLDSSVVLNCNLESSSVIKESAAAAAYASGVTCISRCGMEAVSDGKVEESPNDGAHSTKDGDIIPMKSDQNDIHSGVLSSHSAPESTQVDVVGSIISNHLDLKDTQSCVPKISDLESKEELNYHVDKCSTITEESKSVGCLAKGTKDIRAIGRINVTDGSQSCYHKTEKAVTTAGGRRDFAYQADLKKVRKKGVKPFNDSLKTSEGKCIEGIGQKSEFGILDDALEVARQVAIAVEREVVDYREPFCSSPESDSMETGGGCNHDSEDEKLDQTVVRDVDLNASSSANEDDSASESLTKEASEITQSVSSDLQKSEQDIESPKPDTSIQESVGKFNREKCNLDLNADIHVEELDSFINRIPDIPVNVSAPIPVVASSKGARVLPVTHLHFNGELGWKGSAATSAFRPASARRTPEGEKTHSASKQISSNFLEIDLNIAECEADLVVAPLLVKQSHASAGLPSGDSSMEVSSIKAERLKLDLNCLGDEDVPAYQPRIYHHSTEQSLSSASSSSARQSSLRDFDLNDNPTFTDIGGSHYFDKSSSKDDRCGGPKLDDPVITLMGSTMPVQGKDFFNQAQPYMSNGLTMDPIRPALPYDQMPLGIYGYSGFPTVPGVSMPQSFYAPPGNIPYMVGCGGPTVFPQVIASGGFNGAPSARPSPFLLNIGNAPSSSAGFETLRLGPDLNSETTSGDTGNQGGGEKQFLCQGHGGFVDAQTKVTQPSGSSIIHKRKEPESGWESCPLGYKHMTSWQ